MYTFKHNRRDEVRVDFDGTKFDVNVKFSNGVVDHFTFSVNSEIKDLFPDYISRKMIMEEIIKRHTEGVI